MLNKYRLFQRANGVFHCQDNESGQESSLRTKDRRAAEKLLHVQNEAQRLPTLNLTMARAYLSAHDGNMSTRTWAAVMREMGTHGIESSQERCTRTFGSKAFDPIRHKPLVQTTAEDLLSIVHNNGHSIAHYLRRLHNLACEFGLVGLADPCQACLAKDPRQAPPRRDCRRTREDHREREESGKACLLRIPLRDGRGSVRRSGTHGGDFDWQDRLLVYHRKKLGPDSEPARLSVGAKLRELLESLPKSGDLLSSPQEGEAKCAFHRVPPAVLHRRRLRREPP